MEQIINIIAEQHDMCRDKNRRLRKQIANLCGQVATLTSERDEAREMARELADDTPCRVLASGQCLAHGLHRPPCPHGVAQKLIKQWNRKDGE